MRADREPHIGEYRAKTNAIYNFPYTPRAPDRAYERLPAADGGYKRALLPVVLEHLIANGGQLGPIFLKTGQNDEIALVDHGATEALNVSRASLLLFGRAAALLLLLGEGSGGNRE